jgi:alcohol dehydrogenase class IV
MVGQSRPLWDFEDVDDWYLRVNEEGMAPVVAVPTTSGTGSEVGRASVILDREAHTKKVIFHPRMLPARVICDPALTVNLPPGLTGAVGMDALGHNLEAYCATGFHPLADGIALEAMRLVHRSLVTAYRDGKNIAARAEMMAASSMGAAAFQKGLGAMHAVGHAIGGHFAVHHGTTIAVMMPYVLQLNRQAISERLARLAQALGLAEASADAVIDWVVTLRREVGIPHTLAELGIGAQDIGKLAASARVDPTASTNPVELTLDALEAVIGKAIAGDTD